MSDDGSHHIPVPVDLLKRLLGPDGHIYEGLCPDAFQGWSSRDVDCPHCRDLIRLDELAGGLPAGSRLAELRRKRATWLRSQRKGLEVAR